MRKYYQIIALTVIISQLLIWLVFTFLLPVHWDKNFFLIPIYFFAIEIFFCKLLERFYASKLKLDWYVIFKLSKLMLSILFVGIYIIAIKTEAISFLLKFGVVYLVFLFVETWIFLDYQKQKKKNA